MDGTFRGDRSDAALHDPDLTSYLVASQDRPAGPAVVPGLSIGTRVLNAFSFLHGARRTGIGPREVLARHPGPGKPPSRTRTLWRRLATEVPGYTRTEEARPVQGRMICPLTPECAPPTLLINPDGDECEDAW